VFDEGLPVFSLVAAAALSALLIYLSPLICLPLLARFLPEGENVGPLALPIFTGGPGEVLAGAGFLTILCMVILSIDRTRPIPSWLPMALSLPTAWFLILPSAIVRGGPLLSWLVLGVLIACLFCIHWLVLCAARGIWD